MLTFSTYPSAYGVGYRIFDGDTLLVEQPFKPCEPGFVGMTTEEAADCAQMEITAREAPPEPEPTPEA